MLPVCRFYDGDFEHFSAATQDLDPQTGSGSSMELATVSRTGPLLGTAHGRQRKALTQRSLKPRRRPTRINRKVQDLFAYSSVNTRYVSGLAPTESPPRPQGSWGVEGKLGGLRPHGPPPRKMGGFCAPRPFPPGGLRSKMGTAWSADTDTDTDADADANAVIDSDANATPPTPKLQIQTAFSDNR